MIPLDWPEPCQIAADMLANGKGDPGLLHYRLYDRLVAIDKMCRAKGGALISRQVIACIIENWRDMNEDEKVYG